MTREDVIRQIVELDLQDQGLSAEFVRRNAEQLHAAACEHFGTWDTALQYAGVGVRRVLRKRDFSPDRVLRQIRRLCVGGYSLSAAHNLRRDRRLYVAARRCFGSWKGALRAVGLNLKQAGLGRKRRRMDKQEIIEALRQRHAAGLPLGWSCVCLEDRMLATATRNAFYAWRRALDAADIPQEPVRTSTIRKWDEKVIIERIQDRHREDKLLTHMAVRRDDAALVSAARRYFGNWSEALKAAGIKIPQGGAERPRR